MALTPEPAPLGDLRSAPRCLVAVSARRVIPDNGFQDLTGTLRAQTPENQLVEGSRARSHEGMKPA